jgi:hypothetical protein
MSKLIINIDSTSLSHSGCMMDWFRTVIGVLDSEGKSLGGYKEKLLGPELTYGIALHKYIDIAYKTRGNLIKARHEAKRCFELPTRDHPKKAYLRDQRHLDIVCSNVWTDFCQEDEDFQLMELDLLCWQCRGLKNPVTVCGVCNDTGHLVQPATEVTFSIKYYEDDYIIVNLCGTIDLIGKMNGGPLVKGDWKTSSSWDSEEYFTQYELNRQILMYSLACKLMSEMYPESVLGQIGSKAVQHFFINAIFLDKEPNKVKVIRSQIFPTKKEDIEKFQLTIDDKIKELSNAIKTGYIPKTGIITGNCIKYQNVTEKNFAKCAFWDACKSPDNIAELLLKREFIQKPFNPLTYNEI